MTSEAFCASECLEPTLGARQALLTAMPKGCGLDTNVDPFVAISAICAKNQKNTRCRDFTTGIAGDWCGEVKALPRVAFLAMFA